MDRVKRIDRWPGEGNICSILEEERAPGGGAANVLFDLAAMDPAYPLYAAGRIGGDADGDFLLAEAASRRIDCTLLLRTPGVPTSYTDVMSAPGSRTFFHASGANALLSVADFDAAVDRAEFFYLGYLLLLASLDAPDPQYGSRAARLLAAMRRRGYRTVVDFVSGNPAGFRPAAEAALPHTDILIVNEIEAGGATGLELRRGGLPAVGLLPEALKRLFALGVGEFAVIHFPEGAAAMTRDGAYALTPSCRIAREEIAGHNGAGDAFAAGFLYATGRRLSLEDALRVGSASSYFNLKSPTASGGAVSFPVIEAHLQNGEFDLL
ncbi:hypothetical protein SDC9_145405 [bioreactor metagenome]|uniref:Carbohydrate kinase PfkB domain-containing protein n=1 Tax=bioreactor metagenome TaxID=1076179 RepID=A0A645E9W8_9ZZZZ